MTVSATATGTATVNSVGVSIGGAISFPAATVAIGSTPIILYSAVGGVFRLELVFSTLDFAGAGSTLEVALTLQLAMTTPLNALYASNVIIYTSPLKVITGATVPGLCTAATTPAPATPAPAAGSSSSSCFPESASVTLSNGNTVTMAALKVGDHVRTAAKEFSEVFMFSHKYTDAQATFVELKTATGTIRLSEGHYLYVNGKAAPASSVTVGDLLETATGASAAVTGVSQVRDTGLYNPHTMQGDIIVNGFRTTTYTEAIHPTLAHALLAPVRALHAMNVTF